jgi:hypothetical protein
MNVDGYKLSSALEQDIGLCLCCKDILLPQENKSSFKAVSGYAFSM